MVFLFFLLLFFVLVAFWLILNSPAQKSAVFLTNTGPIIVMALGVLLTIFRRGVIGVPLLFLGLSWWRRMRSMRALPSSSGRRSTVRSASLEMELDHDTGEIDGQVLTGSMEGARLSSLSEEEVLSLYREICVDADSAALLESFLNRYHPAWQEHYDHDSFNANSGASGFDSMTPKEAYQILGLQPGASREEIHQAWRRLVKAVHPDSGGSAFLTAKINAARDLLLG